MAEDTKQEKEITGKQLLHSVIQALQYMDTKYSFASSIDISDEDEATLKSMVMESSDEYSVKLERAKKEHEQDLKDRSLARAAAIDEFLDTLSPKLKSMVEAEKTNPPIPTVWGKKAKPITKKAKSKKKTKVKL